MKNLTLRRIADACGGILHLAAGSPWTADTEIESVTTDSREASEGCLFGAIPGEKVDGHRFIPDVFAKGAACVISEQELSEDAGGNWIKVQNTVAALGAIAGFYLRGLHIPVVGITGSVGKTSTKEMIASVLSQRFEVLKTDGNFNNELGLPLTVFRLREEHEIAVLEMGISHFGEMHRLARIAQPDVCVITNIGDCHLEFLGDRSGVLRAKSEIFDFLRPDGKILLNANDAMLSQLSCVQGITPVRFGFPDEASGVHPAVWADCLESRGLDGTACRIHTPEGDFDALVPIPGEHMVMNALAGTAAGLSFGMSLPEIRQGIEALEPVAGRFRQIRTQEYLIIDDCYNANPVSMKASLKALSEAPGRTVAVLGDMGELGPEERRFHREVGAFAAACAPDCLLCAGALCEELADAARAENPALEVHHFPDTQTLAGSLSKYLQPGDTVLVKASHFMGFERIIRLLTEDI